jgi:MFS family permease
LAVGSFSLGGLPASIIPIYTDRGFSAEAAALAFTLYGAMSVAARFFWGHFANRFAIRTVLLGISAYGAAVSWTILALPGAAALAYAPLVGFCIGGYVSFNQAAWAEYYGRAHLGAITGAVRPLVIISASSGPIVLASIYDRFGDYTYGFLLVTFSWLACFGALLLARPVAKPAAPGSAR